MISQSATINTLSIFLFWFFICVTVACVTIAMVTLHRAKKRDRAKSQSAEADEAQAGPQTPEALPTVVLVHVPTKSGTNKAGFETV